VYGWCIGVEARVISFLSGVQSFLLSVVLTFRKRETIPNGPDKRVLSFLNVEEERSVPLPHSF
jgi:hypothetical protein